MKEVRKHFSKIGLIYLLGSVLAFGTQLLWKMFILKSDISWIRDYNVIIIGNMLMLFLIVYPTIMFLMSKLPKTEITKYKCSFGKWFSLAMISITIMYTSNLFGNYLNKMISNRLNKDMVVPLTNTLDKLNMLTILVFVVIIGPIFEELVFRKTIIDHTVKYGEGMSIILSGLMFGLFHGNLSQFVYAFTLGMFFAYIYIRTGNIKYTIVLHMFINFMGSFLALLVLKNIDLDEYQMVFASKNESLMRAYMNENGLQLMGLFGFVVMALGFFITGIVFFVLNLQKMHLNPTDEALPKGRKFSTIFINIGMIAYIVAWTGMIIYTQLNG